jgi:putative oxidoreductase
MNGFIDRITQSSSGIALLLGRLALTAIFLPSGLEKLENLSGFAQNLAGKGMPAAYAWAVAGAVSEFLGSICVILGLKTRYAALLMIVFTIVAALISHNFWTMQGQPRLSNYIQFMKNLSIIGGFLILFAAGPGSLSLDRKGR